MIRIAKKFYFLVQKNFTSICFFNSCSCRRKSSLFLRFKFSSSTLFASNCSRQARTRRSRSLASDVPTSSRENYSRKKRIRFSILPDCLPWIEFDDISLSFLSLNSSNKNIISKQKSMNCQLTVQSLFDEEIFLH